MIQGNMEAKPNKIVFLVSCSILILTILVFISYYKEVPDIIPIHRNFNGAVDNYGNKNLVWLDFFLNALIISLIGYLINRPHVLNYPVEITAADRTRMYNKMQTFLAYLAVIVSVIFAVITFSFIDILNESNYIFILVLYLVTILVPVFTAKLFLKNT